MIRWSLRQVDGDDDFGDPVYDGMETSPDGKWVQYDYAEARVRELSAENERLRDVQTEHDWQFKKRQEAESRVRELAAENERLRGGLTMEALRTIRSDELARVRGLLVAAESRLAAATALIRRFTSASDSPAEYNATYDEAVAFLANQPAAPSRFQGWPPFDQPSAQAGGFTADELRRLEKPPARLRVVAEACAECAKAGQRTEAERAVLEAVPGPNVLLSYLNCMHWGPVVAAELARRGLK